MRIEVGIFLDRINPKPKNLPQVNETSISILFQPCRLYFLRNFSPWIHRYRCLHDGLHPIVLVFYYKKGVSMKKLLLSILAFAVFILPLFSAQAENKTMAVFVRNDSGNAALDKYKKNAENILSAMVNNAGFSVVSHDLVIRNLNAYLGDENSKYKNIAQKLLDQIKLGNSLDNAVFENASGLRVAEMLGIDYILTVSLSSLGKQEKASTAYGVPTKNVVYTLRCNYNLSEGGFGMGTAGGIAKSQKTIRQTDNVALLYDDEFLNELLEDCVAQMADSLKKQSHSNQIMAKKDAAGEIQLEVRIPEMGMPQVVEAKDGTYYLGNTIVPLGLSVINADIDGINYTIDGGKISLSKGIHYVKISHKDLEPIEKTINITGRPGQKIVFEAVFNEDAKARMKRDAQWLQAIVEKHKMIKRDDARAESDIRIREKLSSAEAERIKGMAEMYKNSGYRIDYKVDADSFPEINKVQSVFSQ